jgi:hypothetical protein
MVVVQTTGGVTTRVRFLAMILTSLGSKSGMPFYLNHRNRVNTILRFVKALQNGGVSADAETCTPGPVRFARKRRYPSRLGLRSNPYHRAGNNDHRSAIAREAIGPMKPMAWAEAWDAALPMAPLLELASVAVWPLPML